MWSKKMFKSNIYKWELLLVFNRDSLKYLLHIIDVIGEKRYHVLRFVLNNDHIFLWIHFTGTIVLKIHLKDDDLH